jgi:hypothetical protein
MSSLCHLCETAEETVKSLPAVRPASIILSNKCRLCVLAIVPAALLLAAAVVEGSGSTHQQTTKTPATKAVKEKEPPISAEGRRCLGCHNTVTPGIVADWKTSKHYAMGTDCSTCHMAAATGNRPDIIAHYGFKIVVLVTPKHCQNCHQREATEFQASRHADAAKFIGSLDNVLGEVVGGGPASDSGCKQCHGSTVALKDGKLDPSTWPNTGIGRINPDESKGTCTACHSRHSFSIAQARTPEACEKCHLGPDHPQMEVWSESKHGMRYHMNVTLNKPINLGAKAGEWIPGKSYSSGPTCASCHISATPNAATTHDVGARLSWTLRPAISTKQEDADKKRAAMQDVCIQCHSRSYVNAFYTQFDRLVDLYNTKFATPSKAIMDRLTAEGKLTNQPFDKPIKWTYYELWHHEGRRARHGAAMSGPDYAWWHGIYDVAKTFYTQFVPEARDLDPKVVDDVLKDMPEHQWFTQGMPPEQIQQVIEFYQGRYKQ